jgi:molybdenum cofactor cytidylyltransferase
MQQWYGWKSHAEALPGVNFLHAGSLKSWHFRNLIMGPMATQLPTVLILAAGRGERFRAAGGTDKLQEILLGRRVRDWVTQAARDSGLPWHVVEAAHTAHITKPGMGDSIACGVAATASAAGWLILPADLPLIQASSLLAVAKALQNHTVVVPFCAGQRGHPVGFGPQAREELLALRGDGGAASVVAAWKQRGGVGVLELEDVGCITDVDTPDALRAAQALALQAGQPVGE